MSPVVISSLNLLETLCAATGRTFGLAISKRGWIPLRLIAAFFRGFAAWDPDRWFLLIGLDNKRRLHIALHLAVAIVLSNGKRIMLPVADF